MDVRWLQRALIRIVLSVIAFMPGLVLVYSGVRYYRLSQGGQAIQARVVSKDIYRDSNRRVATSSVSYRVDYAFTTPKGQTVEGRGSVGLERWRKLKAGDPITVTYLPADPSIHSIGHVPRTGGEILAIFLMAFGTPLAAWGGWRLFNVAWKRRTELRLQREGLVAEATIQKLEMTQSNLPSCYIHYSFRDQSGQTHEGKSSGFYRSEVAGLLVGDKGTVRYDSEKSEASVWVEDTTRFPSRDPLEQPRAVVEVPASETGTQEATEASVAPEEMPAPKKKRGPSAVFLGLLLMIAGANMTYFLVVTRWLVERKIPTQDANAMMAGLIGGVLLVFGFLTAFFGALFGGGASALAKGVRGLLLGLLLVGGGIGAVVYYGQHLGAGGKLEGQAAVPALVAILAIMLGTPVTFVALIYLAVCAVKRARLT